MPSDPRVSLTASFERTAAALAKVQRAFEHAAAAAAFLSLPTAEEHVARLPRIHYADHLTGEEPCDGD